MSENERNRLHRHPTAAEAAAACGAAILSTLRARIERDGHASLAVSGGSTPRLMFEAMAQAEFPWPRLHLFWVDERCVPPNHADSNYRMARETLLDRVEIGGIHRIEAELPPERAAETYAQDLVEYFAGEPHFTALHLGMGADGHTASLFPGLVAVEDSSGLVEAVWVNQLNAYRITLLPRAILAAERIFVLVAGRDKAQALHAVFHGPQTPRQLPIQIIKSRGQAVEWYIDEAAGERLP